VTGAPRRKPLVRHRVAAILITWPQALSVVDPRPLGATTNALARIMATATRQASAA
jgi:hypothetical protein